MKRAMVIILSLLVGLSGRLFAAPPLEDILKALEQVNNQIGVVKVEGYTHRFTWDDGSSSWKITPETTTFSCTYENKPPGRFVLNEDPALMRWEQGSARFIAEWSTEYRDADGVTTRWSKATQHHDGTQFIDDAFVNNEIGRSKQSQFYRSFAQIAEGYYSGLGYTGLKTLKNVPIYFPARFKDMIVSDTKDGMIRIRCTSAEYCMDYDFVLNPGKNFALVRYVYTTNRLMTTADEERTETYEVLEHRQIADGVWYPVHCMHTTRVSKEYEALSRAEASKHGLPGISDRYSSRRVELVLTNVTLLDGDEAEKNLTVKLPDDVAIRNEDEH